MSLRLTSVIAYFLVINSNRCKLVNVGFRKTEFEKLFVGSIKTYVQGKKNGITLLHTRNTCAQQTLAHPSNIPLENPSKIHNFSKLSKRQIVLTITGRGNAIKKTQHLATHINNPNRNVFYI